MNKKGFSSVLVLLLLTLVIIITVLYNLKTLPIKTNKDKDPETMEVTIADSAEKSKNGKNGESEKNIISEYNNSEYGYTYKLKEPLYYINVPGHLRTQNTNIIDGHRLSRTDDGSGLITVNVTDTPVKEITMFWNFSEGGYEFNSIVEERNTNAGNLKVARVRASDVASPGETIPKYSFIETYIKLDDPYYLVITADPSYEREFDYILNTLVLR